MNVGLFFGSFNPIHIGHLIIAQFILNETEVDQIWMVVSPQNPLKEKSTLARDYDRLHMVQLATEDHPKIKASNIEFGLPRPSYTIDTMIHLKEKYPQHKFILIMGGDILQSLPKWKNYELLLRDYPIIIYKRPNYSSDSDVLQKGNFTLLDAPLLEISSTKIRQLIRQGKSVQYLVPEKVFEEINFRNFYKSNEPEN